MEKAKTFAWLNKRDLWHRKYTRLMRKMLKVLTAYSAFEDSFGSVNIAGRLGLFRGKERKILLSSAAIWLIYSYLRFQSPDK